MIRGVALCSWLLGASIGITHARFLPNPEYALIGGFGNTLGIYDIKTGKKKKKYNGIVNANYPLVHSYGKIADDSYIFGASETDEVKIWNMKSEATEYTVKLPQDSQGNNNGNFAACVDYHEKSKRLAVCGPNSRNASYLYQLP